VEERVTLSSAHTAGWAPAAGGVRHCPWLLVLCGASFGIK
jgi:hypothetical protein